MVARSSRTSKAAPAQRASASTPLDWTADWTRQQLLVANEGARALFRGMQAMRGIQEQAAREATQRHAAAAERLRRAGTPAELFALQGELVRSNVESATRYWQELAGAALEMNTELAGCTAQLVDTEDVLAATSARFLHS